MLTLSSELCAPPSAADRPSEGAFRENLRPDDRVQVERLVSGAGVFNAEEIAVARELVEEALRAGNASGYHFLIADGSSGFDGYACFGPIPGTDRRYELYWIVTRPAAQRRGLARTLLEATQASVRSRGGTHLFAETSMRSDYAPAHALYSALGYTRFCIVPDYHGDGDGLGIFGKRL